MSTDSTVVVPQQSYSDQEINPHNLLDVISFIEQQYSNEVGGAETTGALFTIKQWWEFWEVGFKTSLKSGLVLAMLTPVAVGVMERLIPIFGDKEPTLFDMCFALLLSFGFPLLLALFIAQSTAKHRAGYTRKMVKAFMSGMAQGTALKAALIFILFHFVYIVVLTNDNILKALMRLEKIHVSVERLAGWAQWIMDAREVLLTSAWIVVGTSVLAVALPYGSFYRTKFRIAKDVAEGRYKQPRE